ncbi:MAG: class I SAM-dependent methyltransferase [Acidobacteria bacterium]|nr:class I SAM-dependent methyltransferase [Acidobacteriota bacterium]
MGVDIWSLDFLLRLRCPPFGATLFLGRQGFHLPDQLRDMARQVVATHHPNVALEDLQGTSGYAEKLFEYLGATTIESLDYSDYEGASLIYDMNRPLPAEMHERFDTVFDGGTLEHVFNFPVAIENMKGLLKIGGRAIMVTPANNWLGHGLYQFSPELLYRVFSRRAGFEVEIMEMVEINSYPRPRHAEDPEAVGRRIEIQRTAMPTYLCVCARKFMRTNPSEFMQSDYASLWKAKDTPKNR